MAGEEKPTENQIELCNSGQNGLRTNASLRADDRHDKLDPPRQINDRGDTRYRPPVEETQKFHLAALLWLSVISLLLVPMATLLDIPIARNFQADFLPQEVSKMLDLSLIYAHGSGIFLIMLAILMMAPTKRWKMPRLATLALGSGAVATLVKMFVLRPRPNSLKLDLATNEHAWIWSFDWTLSRIAEYDAGMRAFPSGYLATATALTVGLWIVVPRGRPLFLAFCIGTMLQRMYCGSHFLSDLFGSAAVGLGWCYICYHPKLIGNVFDKMEAVPSPKRRLATDQEPVGVQPAFGRHQQIHERHTHSAMPAAHFNKSPVQSDARERSTVAPADTNVAASQANPHNNENSRSNNEVTTSTRVPPRHFPPSQQPRTQDGDEPRAA